MRRKHFQNESTSRPGSGFFDLAAGLPVAIWLYLLTLRSGYWQMRRHVLPVFSPPYPARTVVAVIPARNEADVIAVAVRSLLSQNLPVALQIIVVDDGSEDGTASVVDEEASRMNAAGRVTVLPGKPLPPGWTGKMWAVSQGVEAAGKFAPDYLLLTDADIEHGPQVIGDLLTLAEKQNLHLASLMVTLATRSFAEQLLIPAFVYFFFQLYPPLAVRRTDTRTAAAAGGCMLVRSGTLQAIGGVRTIANAMIDDCALAKAVKQSDSPIWLGLGTRSSSLRSYGGWSGVGGMISRSAFNQLDHSTVLLVLTIASLGLTYLSPILFLFSRKRSRQSAGLAAFAMMSASYFPVQKLYRQSALSALTLPLAAIFYAGATINSARRYWLGKGGSWKGRIQDQP